jgi:hypothetical protein
MFLMLPTNEVLLGVIDLSEAKRIRSILEDRGVQLRLHSNPDTCASGACRPTVEVFVAEIDVPKVRELFQQEQARSLEGLEVDLARTQEVFDPEKATARCPACGTEFSTQLKECPDCGLVFMPS